MRNLYAIKYIIIANLCLTSVLLISNNKLVNWVSIIITIYFDLLCLYSYQKSLKARMKVNEEQVTQGKRSLIILLQTIGTIIFTLICIFFKIDAHIFLLVNLLWALQLFSIYEISRFTSDLVYATFKRSKSIAVIGNDIDVHKIVPLLRQRKQFDVKGYFDIDESSPSNLTDFGGNEYLGSFSKAVQLAVKNDITELFVSPTSLAEKHFNQLATEAENNCIKLRVIDPKPVMLESYRFKRKINGLVINSKYNEPLSLLQNRIIKRIFDVVISGLVVVFILSWLIPIVALLVKLESRGPVFFRQKRSGRNNKPFWCLKFRSMTPNKEANVKQATKGDARITKVGAFLRKTSLDEMPQFLNVITGDMSICGPRPHMLSHTDEFSALINDYMVRLYVKPGITGWAQVNGYRGETFELIQMEKRVEYDIEYLQNWTLTNDFVIMLNTIKFLFKPNENTF